MPTRPVYVCPHCKTRIPFGTETEPPPTRCPGCYARLGIPSVVTLLPWIEVTCPACAGIVRTERANAGKRCRCPKCGALVDVPADPPT